MNIPFLDLKAQYRNIKPEIDKKISEVLSSQKFILGPEVEELEKELASYCGTTSAVGVSSGSDALLVSLMALDVKRKDKVITTPFTFLATAGAIARMGAIPVFCDIQDDTYNIDPQKLEELLRKEKAEHRNSKIKAVIPVHLYGQCTEMNSVCFLAKKFRLKVIEDAAQAVGTDFKTPQGVKKAGTMGNIGILSFFPSKNLGGFGDGGMVITNDSGLASKIKMLRIHGSPKKYYYHYIGGNFRLDALQAAVLRVKLKYLNTWLRERKEKANIYERLFSDTGLREKGLVSLPQAVYKHEGIDHYHTYHQYVIKAQARDRLKDFLKKEGISTAIYYPLPLHLQKCFSYLGYQKGDFPQSEKASSQVLALPIYPELSEKQQEYIVSSINRFYQKKGKII